MKLTKCSRKAVLILGLGWLATGLLRVADLQSQGLVLEGRFGPAGIPVATGDVDGDGRNEIVFGWSLGWDLQMGSTAVVLVGKYVSSYDYRYVWRNLLPESEPNITAVAIGDVDSDGQNEIVVANSVPSDANPNGKVRIYEHTTGNNYVEAWSYQLGEFVYPHGLAVGDCDNDGKNELVIGLMWYGRKVMVFEHLTGNNYQLSAEGIWGSDVVSVAVGDADNDGHNEIVAGRSDWSAYDVVSYDYSGGTFIEKWSHSFGGRQQIALGDVDNDGLNELVVCSHSASGGSAQDVHIFKNYGQVTSFGIPAGTFFPYIGDVLNKGYNQLVFNTVTANSPFDQFNTYFVYAFEGGSYRLKKSFEVHYSSGEELGGTCVADVDGDGKNELLLGSIVVNVSEVTGVTGTTSAGVVFEYSLLNNYPNPFNPETTIGFAVQKPGRVEVHIFNQLGQKVRTLVDENKLPGEYTIKWDGNNDAGMQVAAGTYFYQLKAGDFVSSKKMLLLR